MPSVSVKPTKMRRYLRVFGVLAGVIAVAFAIRVLAGGSMLLPDVAQDFFTLTFSVIIESTPFVLLGILLAAGLQAFVKQSTVIKLLPRNGFLRRAVLSLLGVVMPVCECGNVPMARGLMLKGLAASDATTFLLAAPIVNPLVIITTQQAFGWDNGILVGRLVGGFLIANLVGWLFSLKANQSELLTKQFNDTCQHEHASSKGKLNQFGGSLLEELNSLMPALLLGSAVAGAIQAIIPKDVLTSVGQNPYLSILAMIALGVIVSICSNVDAFFALSFAASFLPGSILVFLLVGPLVDVKMIALMRTTYTTKAVLLIVSLVLLAAAVIGLGVNTLG